jgi:hypothetical protein
MRNSFSRPKPSPERRKGVSAGKNLGYCLKAKAPVMATSRAPGLRRASAARLAQKRPFRYNPFYKQNKR